MALTCWKLQKVLPELFYVTQSSSWAWKWLAIKKFPSVSKTKREEREHFLCLQLIWSYGLLASAFQTDFSKWKYFIIFPVKRKSNRFCSTVDHKKQKAEIWKSDPTEGGIAKIYCMSKNTSTHTLFDFIYIYM